MKISELCKMIEDSIHSEKYPLEGNQRHLASLVQVINRSSSDDLKSNDIKIEVRIHDLYVLSNYVQNIQHLPGVIEMDVLDFFKMLCRRLERIDKSSNKATGTTTISTEKLSLSNNRTP
jgi:hypothetical protein